MGGIGQLGGMAGVGQSTMGKWAPQAFGQTGNIIGQKGMSIAQQAATTMPGKAASWAMGKPAVEKSRTTVTNSKQQQQEFEAGVQELN